MKQTKQKLALALVFSALLLTGCSSYGDVETLLRAPSDLLDRAACVNPVESLKSPPSFLAQKSIVCAAVLCYHTIKNGLFNCNQVQEESI